MLAKIKAITYIANKWVWYFVQNTRIDRCNEHNFIIDINWFCIVFNYIEWFFYKKKSNGQKYKIKEIQYNFDDFLKYIK